jgi:BlaI family transcriptional regulator, penicillinase repressor
MPKNDHSHLSRRERQIMDVIYQRERATAADVQSGLPDAPGYSAVRALLAILVEKGHLKIEEDGARYVYLPTRARTQAGRQAIRQVMDTFFGGSVENAVVALLDSRDTKLSAEEVGRLQELIEQSRKGGK